MEFVLFFIKNKMGLAGFGRGWKIFEIYEKIEKMTIFWKSNSFVMKVWDNWDLIEDFEFLEKIKILIFSKIFLI